MIYIIYYHIKVRNICILNFIRQGVCDTSSTFSHVCCGFFFWPRGRNNGHPYDVRILLVDHNIIFIFIISSHNDASSLRLNFFWLGRRCVFNPLHRSHSHSEHAFCRGRPRVPEATIHRISWHFAPWKHKLPQGHRRTPATRRAPFGDWFERTSTVWPWPRARVGCQIYLSIKETQSIITLSATMISGCFENPTTI